MLLYPNKYVFLLILMAVLSFGCRAKSDAINDLSLQLKKYKLAVKLDTSALELTIWLKDAWLTGDKTSLDNAYRLKALSVTALDELSVYHKAETSQLNRLNKIKKLLDDYYSAGENLGALYRLKRNLKNSPEQNKFHRLMWSLFKEINSLLAQYNRELESKLSVLAR